jgi:hypothetical protein
MRVEPRLIPNKAELFTALEALIELQLERPDWITENDLARAASLLTLECAGGPEMPTKEERAERFQAVRNLLRKIARRFAALSQAELEAASLVYPRGEPKDSARYEREAKRLSYAPRALFQLNISEPDQDVDMGELRTAANAIWGKPEHPKSRWFERNREEFVLETLAEWIREHEETYREAGPLPSSDGDADSLPPATETTNPHEDEDRSDECEGTEANEADVIGREDEALARLPSTAETGRRVRVRRRAGLAFICVLVAGALGVVLVLAGGGEAPENPAGKVNRILSVPASEDIAAAGDHAWLVDADNQTAVRIPQTDGQPETIFVDQPPFVSKPLPGTHTGARLGGYRVAAGADRAWIATSGGSVLTIKATGRKVRTLNPRVRVLAGEPALYRGSLWIGGFGESLYRLRANSGVVQRTYALQGHPFAIDKVAAGVGSVWAYTDGSGEDNPRLYKLTPVPGRLGVEEAILPLDRPATDLAAGLGGVWTVDAGGTVTWHDPATGGSSRPIRIPGGAQSIALSQDAVWVTTGDNTAVRIDPITYKRVGAPISLPGEPSAIAANESVWVVAGRKLVEISE